LRTWSTKPPVSDAIPFFVHYRSAVSIGFQMAPGHSLEDIAHEIGAASFEQRFANFVDCVFERARDRALDYNFAPDRRIRAARRAILRN
jgi:hypothetical protein